MFEKYTIDDSTTLKKILKRESFFMWKVCEKRNVTSSYSQPTLPTDFLVFQQSQLPLGFLENLFSGLLEYFHPSRVQTLVGQNN